MLLIERTAAATLPAVAVLVLTAAQRQLRRQHAALDTGEPVALRLPQAASLHPGERLEASDGRIIEVRAAPEPLIAARACDAQLLARAAYHLGNRHVPICVDGLELRLQHDHVLEDLLQRLGMELRRIEAPFEPESGAYGHGHAHTAPVPARRPVIHEFGAGAT
jgi:urease accessory protein